MSETPQRDVPRKLMSISEYAKHYGVTRGTVWRWIRKGAVEIVQKGPRTAVRVVAD
jgi:transposase